MASNRVRSVIGSYLSLFIVLFATRVGAQQMPSLTLMPVPASVKLGDGSLRIDSAFSVALTGYTEPRLERAVERFRGQLSRQTGIAIAGKAASPALLVVHTDHASKAVQEVGEDESLSLIHI